jgi:hypothetical protein
MRLQHGSNPSLPGQGDAPQQEAGALLRRLEPRPRTRYEERSLATAINDAIVSGKSAVIIGPICCA